MSNPFLEHAEREFKLAGYDDGDAMNALMKENVTELLKVFDGQGHSGFSAGFAVGLFKALASWEPISPLTGEESEWRELGGGSFQNIRCSRVFKNQNGFAYDVEGYVFEDEKGLHFTCGESRKPVTFPYTPKTEIIKLDDPRHPDFEEDSDES